MIHTYIDSPIGPLLATGDGRRLAGLYLEEHRRGPAVGPDWERDDCAYGSVRRQLEEYFAGERREFSLELAAAGTVWQKRVWAQLTRISFGETRSYGELAACVCTPAAARAVGAANARNPVAVVVPCHRVIGAAGALTGYAGGLDSKRWLLSHEADVLAGTGAKNEELPRNAQV